MSALSWINNRLDRLPGWLGRAEAKSSSKKEASPGLPLAPTRLVVQASPTMDTYRQAMQQARQGSRRTLLSLYEQAGQDAHLESVMQQRSLATLSRPFMAMGPDGQPHADATQALAGNWFRDFMQLALRSVYYGPGLIQLGPPRPQGGFAKATAVPEILLLPETGEVEADGNRRIRYTDAPYADWAIPTGTAAEPGLLARAVPLVLAKQQALAGWNKHLELFAMPYRKAHTDMKDSSQVSRLVTMMTQMGSAGWGVFDTEDRVDLLQATAGGGQQGYESLCRFADEQLSKLMLGQTMTTDKGGSLAQAQVHERTAQALFRADALALENLVNTELLPRMERLGMPVAGAKFSFLPDENALPPELKLELVRVLLPQYRIPASWLSEEFGIQLE